MKNLIVRIWNLADTSNLITSVFIHSAVNGELLDRDTFISRLKWVVNNFNRKYIMSNFNLNKVTLIGHIGADPEVRIQEGKKPFATISLGTSRGYKMDGKWEKTPTQWHKVIVFGEIVNKLIKPYLKKGMALFVEGELDYRAWEDKDGVGKLSTRIIASGIQIVDSNNTGECLRTSVLPTDQVAA